LLAAIHQPKDASSNNDKNENLKSLDESTHMVD